VVPLYIKGSLFISFDFKSIPKYIVPSLVLAQNHHPPACSSSPLFPVFQVVQCRLCMCPPLCGDTASPHQAKAAAVLRGSRAALCAFRFPFVTAVIFRCPRGPYNRHLLEASWIAKAIYLRAVFHRRESSPTILSSKPNRPLPGPVTTPDPCFRGRAAGSFFARSLFSLQSVSASSPPTPPQQCPVSPQPELHPCLFSSFSVPVLPPLSARMVFVVSSALAHFF